MSAKFPTKRPLHFPPHRRYVAFQVLDPSLSYTVQFYIQSRNKSSQRPHMYVRQGEQGLDLESVSGYGLWIQTLDPDYFQNVTGTSLSMSKDISVVKKIIKIRSLSSEI